MRWVKVQVCSDDGAKTFLSVDVFDEEANVIGGNPENQSQKIDVRPTLR